MAKLLVIGSVEGIEFVKSGSFVNKETHEKQTYGSSISLQFSELVDIVKSGIKTKAKRTFGVKVPIDESLDLEDQVKYYNTFIGKDVELNLIPTDGQKFSLSGDIKVIK